MRHARTTHMWVCRGARAWQVRVYHVMRRLRDVELKRHILIMCHLNDRNIFFIATLKGVIIVWLQVVIKLKTYLIKVIG